MSDLPEINFKEKKDRKKGFIPWLRSHVGVGGKGAMGGEALPGAAKFGQGAFGAAKLGAASGAAGGGLSGLGGIGALLAGKIGLIVTAVVVGSAIGMTLYMKAPSNPKAGTSSFNSGKTSENYVPAILRGTKNPGSSLDMFRETNSGALSMDENAAAGAADENGDTSKDKPAPEDKAGEGADAQASEQDNMGNMEQKMLGKLAGSFSAGGLSTSLGSAGGQFSNMGGFSNKFNTGAVGAQSDGLSSLSAGFVTTPKFDQRKKLLASKGSARPVFSNAKGGKPMDRVGKGAFAQAKGVKSAQQTTVGSTSADQQRSTQDKAWEGTTTDAVTTGTGGAGTTSGGSGGSGGTGTSGTDGSGIVTSPSLDNTSGGGTAANETTASAPGTGDDVSPWKGLPERAMMLILLSSVLSIIGAWVVDLGRALMGNPYTAAIGAIVYAIGIMICTIALAVAAMATAIGVKLISTYGQKMLGTIYTIGGGIASTAAIQAMTGISIGPVKPMWMAAIAGILGLLGGMAGGSSSSSTSRAPASQQTQVCQVVQNQKGGMIS
ncbi:MAG: hypothetical protein WCK75_06275 [Elusimicrobiota bacterium]